MVIVVTESNNVYALDAATVSYYLAEKRRDPSLRRVCPVGPRKPIWYHWHTNRGSSFALALLFNAMTTPPRIKHFIYLLKRPYRRHQSQLAGRSESPPAIRVSRFTSLCGERARRARHW